MTAVVGRINARSTLATGLLLVVLGTSGCSSTSSDGHTSAASGSTQSGSPSATASGSPTTSTSPTATGKPARQRPQGAGPAVAISSIAPSTGSTVGVAMPISVVFSQAVSPSLHAQIEKHLDVTTSEPVTGAWHWFGTRRVDFRPKSFWKTGTTVSLSARLGQETLTRHFTVGADVRTHVYVQRHKTVVTENGTVTRTMPSDAGSPSWPSWTGTMAVVNTAPTVQMDSCSVHIACSPSDPNYYDLELPWDVRITWSGTFLHYSPADPQPGHANGSHGCVHLSLADAEWFYHHSKPGDPVTVTGSGRAKADPDNGYAGFNVSWKTWVAGSAAGAFTTRQA